MWPWWDANWNWSTVVGTNPVWGRFSFCSFCFGFCLGLVFKKFLRSTGKQCWKWILLLILDYAYPAFEFELSCTSSQYEVVREVQLAFLGKLEFPAFHEGCRIKGGKDYYFLLFSENFSVFFPKACKVFCSWSEEKFSFNFFITIETRGAQNHKMEHINL